jgi:hypothetical protein
MSSDGASAGTRPDGRSLFFPQPFRSEPRRSNQKIKTAETIFLHSHKLGTIAKAYDNFKMQKKAPTDLL